MQMKKNRFIGDVIIMMSVLLIAIAAGIFFRVSVGDCGLAQIDHVDDIKANMVTLDFAIEKDEHFGESGIKKIVDSLDFSPIIVIAKSTGNLVQADGSYGQEIIISEIIRGEEYVSKEKKCWIYQSFGMQEVNGKILFMNSNLNIMNPEYEYLVFMEASPLNIYQEEQVYLLSSEILGYIRISEPKTKSLEKESYHKVDFV